MDVDARSEAKLGGIGHYRLSFSPLVGTASKRLYRTRPFNMKSRLGANSDIDDSNLVVWNEMTHAGILNDGLETRVSPRSASIRSSKLTCQRSPCGTSWSTGRSSGSSSIFARRILRPNRLSLSGASTVDRLEELQ